jgi:carboxymethylenebutenolidase
MTDLTSHHLTRPLTRASDFEPEVLQLFDQYVHGQIDRRGFLDRASAHARLGVSAAMLLEALNPKFALAQKVAPTDPRIVVERIEIASPNGYGTVKGLLARPAGVKTKLPSVLVAHENRGLNPHIEDIARRLAVAGHLALAPDALSSLGGYPGNEDMARDYFAQLDQGKTREDFLAAASWLSAHPASNGRLGTVGFCWGGGMVNVLATRLPNLAAAAPFYGPAPAKDKVAGIRAEMVLHFAGTDERINGMWPDFEAGLKAAGVKYEAHVYPGTQHGFNNDTTPRFDEAAAKLAWDRTLALFDRTLKT